jgi:DNA-binding NarL/FixJ family response regulator
VNEELTTTQLRRALRATAELAELRELAEYPARVAHLLREVIPADLAGYNALELARGRATVVADPSDSVFDGGAEELAQFIHQNPMLTHAIGGSTDALRLSDFITRRELHRTELYQYVYRLIPQEYQLGIMLPSPWPESARPPGVVALSLGRARRDFSGGELQLLQTLAPHLTATLERLHELALARATTCSPERCVVLVDSDGAVAWATTAAGELGLVTGSPLPVALGEWVAGQRANGRHGATTASISGRRVRARLVADAYPGLDALHITPADALPDAAQLAQLGLSRRQADVLALALRGHGTTEIATSLYLSRRTVEKHFEALYARLGVNSKSQAIVTVMSMLER